MRFPVLVCVTAAILSADAGVRSLTPTPRDAAWLASREAEKKAAVAAGGSKVVFLGDSVVSFFETGAGAQVWNRVFAAEPYKALNLAFFGDRTENLLWRITEGKLLDGYEAKAVVLLTGTGNIQQAGADEEPPIDTFLAIRRIVRTVQEKQPKAKVVLCPILPIGQTPGDPRRKRADVVNVELARLADNRNVFWCDFSRQLLTSDGVLAADISSDYTHPWERACEIFASAVLPYVNLGMKGDDGLAWPSLYAPVTDSSALALSGAPALRPCVNAFPNPANGKDWWPLRLERNRTFVSDMGDGVEWVFLGDSITHFWERDGQRVWAEMTKGRVALNAGYAGDAVENVHWRVLNGELNGCRPKRIFLMIGTNNCGGSYDTPEQTAEGIRRLVGTLCRMQPQAQVVLQAIFPRAHASDRKGEDSPDARNRRVNAAIRDLADGTHVVWLDFTAKFRKADGSLDHGLFGDGLHPNEAGYRVWREALKPYLGE